MEGILASYLILFGTAYFLPTIIAACRGHHSPGAIFAFNLLLGWTFLGWVLALVWSLTYVIPRPEADSPQSGKSPVTAIVVIGVVVALIVVANQVRRSTTTLSHSSPSQTTYERPASIRPTLETASINMPIEKQPNAAEKVKREAERVHWCRAELKKPADKRSTKVDKLCATEQRQEALKRK